MPMMKKIRQYDEEQKEEEFGDSGRGRSDSGESEERRRECDDEKNSSPF